MTGLDSDKLRSVLVEYWASTDEYLERLAEARSIISDAIKKYSRPYVAYSGGKDSTCVLALVLEQIPNVEVIHWDYGPYYIPRRLEDEFIRNAQGIGAKHVRVLTSDLYVKLGRNARGVLGREFLGKWQYRLMEEGFDLAFVGLRAEESLKRRRRIKAGDEAGVIPECWPIKSWKWQDVWAYIWSNNLPYASIYDQYAALVGWDSARLTTFFDSEFDHLGASDVDGVVMWRFKHHPVNKKPDRPG